MRHLKQSAVKCLVVMFLMPGFAFSSGERTVLQAGLPVASGIGFFSHCFSEQHSSVDDIVTLPVSPPVWCKLK